MKELIGIAILIVGLFSGTKVKIGIHRIIR